MSPTETPAMQLHHARPRPPYQGRDPRLREVPTERNPAMSGHIGEGLIRCHVCGAVVPSIDSVIDLPGAPEDGQPAFFPTVTPPCTIRAAATATTRRRWNT